MILYALSSTGSIITLLQSPGLTRKPKSVARRPSIPSVGSICTCFITTSRQLMTKSLLTIFSTALSMSCSRVRPSRPGGSSTTDTCDIYRGEDLLEKAFGNLKERLNLRRTAVSSEENLDGKLFVQFVALIFLAYIDALMREKTSIVITHCRSCSTSLTSSNVLSTPASKDISAR